MATIRQYAAWAEQRIARLAVAEGLHLGLLGVSQGPLTLTYRVRLLQPQPAALRKLLTLGPALQQALQCSGVRVTEQPGHIAIEIPSPQPRTPAAGELARATRGLQLAVGFDAQRRPVHVDLRQHGALFWIGPSRRGKTQSMKSSLFALARANSGRLKFAILCHERKRADWQAFEPAAGCLGIVTEPAEQEQALEWFAGELLACKTPFTFAVVADDLLNLLSRAELAEPLAELASMGAGLGVHLLAGTQEAGSRRGTGGAGIEANITARVLYRSSNAASAARATGQGAEGLQQLSGAKGDALLLLDGEPQRVATGLADDREIMQLEQGAGWLHPWRSAPVSPVQPAPHRDGVAGADVGHTWGSGAGGAQSDKVVQDGAAPVLDGEPVTTEQREQVRAVYARLGSKNAACKALWGYKNSKTYAWLTECIEESEQPAEKLTIDMGSDEGLAVLAELQQAGVLPRDTITELIKPS